MAGSSQRHGHTRSGKRQARAKIQACQCWQTPLPDPHSSHPVPHPGPNWHLNADSSVDLIHLWLAIFTGCGSFESRIAKLLWNHWVIPGSQPGVFRRTANTTQVLKMQISGPQPDLVQNLHFKCMPQGLPVLAHSLRLRVQIPSLPPRRTPGEIFHCLIPWQLLLHSFAPSLFPSFSIVLTSL